MKNFFIVTRDESHSSVISQIISYIKLHGGNCSYGINPDDSSEQKLVVPENTECILSIGGDGTLVRAAQNTLGMNIPLLGINYGHLGYLCDLDPATMYDGLDALFADAYSIEDRMMLSGHLLTKKEGESAEIPALNDIVLGATVGLQAISVRVYVNGSYLYAYYCDGIIFSTPTGSTAYNLSANGPIVNPKTNVILLTPINPHTLNARAIVLDPYDEIAVEFCARREGERSVATVCFDGSHKKILRIGEKLIVKRAEQTTKMIHLEDISFLDRIRNKMQET